MFCKVIFLFIAFSLCTFNLPAQSGRVIYKLISTAEAHATLDEAAEGLPMGQQEGFKTAIKGMEAEYPQMRFELLYTPEHAQYRLIPYLPQGDQLGHILAKARTGGNRVYYRNTQKRENIMQVEQTGQRINVQMPYEAYEWSVTEEERRIGQYACKKATTVVDYYDKGRERQIYYEIEAWFTPEIPLPYGPKGMDGLPGLVLEAGVVGKPWSTFTIDSLTEGLSAEQEKGIRLKKAKTVSKKEYDAYIEQQIKSRQ